MTENNIKLEYLQYLEKDFDVQTEVSGTHFTGKRLKIDAVVKPKDTTKWKNKNVAFGIEFKDINRFRTNHDTKDFTKWLAQCVDYTNTKWSDFGYIYIFVCPSLIDTLAPSILNNEIFFIANFMSQLGIGELKHTQYYGLSFLLNRHHRIWSLKNGVEEGKRYTLIRKFGSR